MDFGRSNRLQPFFRFSPLLHHLLQPFLMAKDLSNHADTAVSENGTVQVSDVDKIQLKNTEPGTGSQFKEFLKTVIRFSGDLSSLTCPAFFLNGLSLLEYG
jgi:hypothetical protein